MFPAAEAKEYDLADKSKLADFLEDADIRLEVQLSVQDGTTLQSCQVYLASRGLEARSVTAYRARHTSEAKGFATARKWGLGASGLVRSLLASLRWLPCQGGPGMRRISKDALQVIVRNLKGRKQRETLRRSLSQPRHVGRLYSCTPAYANHWCKCSVHEATVSPSTCSRQRLCGQLSFYPRPWVPGHPARG